ncbi:hypothetical protein C0989_011650, partial [Termitomyces sp. Mn162]
EMEYIKAKLDEITSQHCLLLFLFHSINNDKVNECVARLDNAMEKFMLRHTIDNAEMFSWLKQHIITFYNEQKKDLKILWLEIDDVKTILGEHLP